MSEVEQILTNGEELPMEDQKKAINMQDLVYVKNYIDKRQNDYEAEMDVKHTTFKDDVNEDNTAFRDEMNANYTNVVADNTEFKNEIATDNANFKADIQSTILTTIDQGMEEQIGEFRTSVDNIISGTTPAGDASKVQGVDLSGDSAATFGDYVVRKKLLLLNTGETGNKYMIDNDVVYDMPAGMTFDGTYCMELGDGSIVYFKPSNRGGDVNTYTYSHPKITYQPAAGSSSEDLVLWVTDYRFDFYNRKITIRHNYTRHVAISDHAIGYGQSYLICKLWEIIE